MPDKKKKRRRVKVRGREPELYVAHSLFGDVMALLVYEHGNVLAIEELLYLEPEDAWHGKRTTLEGELRDLLDVDEALEAAAQRFNQQYQHAVRTRTKSDPSLSFRDLVPLDSLESLRRPLSGCVSLGLRKPRMLEALSRSVLAPELRAKLADTSALLQRVRIETLEPKTFRPEEAP